MVREHQRLARLFGEWVAREPDFEMLAPVPFGLVCFRWNDGRRTDDELNAFNKSLLDRINASGSVFLTHTVLRGAFALRMVVGQRTTEERHVRAAWETAVSSARELARA